MNADVAVGARGGIRRAVALDCEMIGERSDNIWRHRATDLSLGGMWLHTANPARAGEQIVLCFRPDSHWSGRELMLFAEVVRVTSVRPTADELPPNAGMGVEFLDLTGPERSQLQSWLDRRRQPVPRRRRPVARKAPSGTAPSAASPAAAVGSVAEPIAAPAVAPRGNAAPFALRSCWR